MIAKQNRSSGSNALMRSAADKLRGEVIEAVLCQSRVSVSPCLYRSTTDGLVPFAARGLARWDGMDLCLSDEGLPYARVIASLFDNYRRETTRRFSSAI